MLRRRKREPHGLRPGHQRIWPRHTKFVRGFECLACQKAPPPDQYLPINKIRPHPIEVAHVRDGTDGGTGLKPSDWWTVPFCPAHHEEQHAIGEAAFCAKYRLDMKAEALALAKRSPDRDMVAVMKGLGAV